jgi:hypothetical protein
MTILSRSGRLDPQDMEDLRARLTEVEAALDARLKEASRVRTSLAEFRVRYREQAGSLHDELEELESAIEEAELGERSKRAGDYAATAPATPAPDTLPRYTSDAVRRLFRDVAKTIHPDLAADDESRGRRHALMIEANKAYALGDEERLRWILDAWERSPEIVQGSDPEATRLRIVRRIAQLEEQLHACRAELRALHESPLGRLKTMVEQAAARGNDLVGEMIDRLKRDVMVARNRLDAIRSQP